MEVLNKLVKDSKTIPQTFKYKLYHNIRPLTLEDQKEALTRAGWSYYFARANIPGSDIKALQAKACEDPGWVYYFAKDIPGVDVKALYAKVCEDLFWGLIFKKTFQSNILI